MVLNGWGIKWQIKFCVDTRNPHVKAAILITPEERQTVCKLSALWKENLVMQ